MKKMPIPKRKGKNRAQAKGSTWEFELLGAFSGLVLLVCAGLFFFSQEYASMAEMLAVALGGVVNAVLAVLVSGRKHYLACVLFGIVSTLLFILFFLKITGLEI